MILSSGVPRTTSTSYKRVRRTTTTISSTPADHSPLSAGGATLGLHGGGFQSDGGGGGGFGGGSTFFNYANGQFLNGLLTVAYELETVRKGEGGFACVAGCER